MANSFFPRTIINQKVFSNVGKYFLYCMILGIMACSSGKISEQEVKQYVQDPENGVTLKKTINGIEVKVAYKPSDLLIMQELNSMGKVADTDIDELTEKYKNYIYFVLAISKDDQEILSAATQGKSQFGAMINKLAFEMDNYVYLTNSNKDTLSLVDYIYPRMFGQGNSSTMLFAFDSKKIKNAEWLKFSLLDFGLGTGNCNFKFMTEDIWETPEIAYNELIL